MNHRLFPVVAWVTALTAGIIPSLLTPHPVGANQGSAPLAVILIVDKLAVEDFSDFPSALEHLSRLADQGGVGLMNVRTAKGTDSGSGHLSLGVGKRTATGNRSGEALEHGETIHNMDAAAYYRTIWGQLPRGQVFHVHFGDLRRASQLHGAQPGALGEVLARHQIVPAVLGNQDVLGERRRYGPLIFMNAEGVVPNGEVGRSLLTPDPTWPGHWRTDYEKTFQRLVEMFNENHVIAVELGDLARLESFSVQLNDTRRRTLRQEALKDIDQFVMRVHHAMSSNPARPSILYLVSPSPSTEFQRTGVLMTPFFRWVIDQDGDADANALAGLLVSPTTRRPGIVANTDFLPTLLTDLNVPLFQGITGRRARVTAHDRPLAHLLQRYDEIRSVHLQRLPVIQPYFFGLLGFMSLGALLTVLVRYSFLRWTSRHDTLWRLLATAFASFPLALLILPLFPSAPLGTTWLSIATLTGLSTLIAAIIGRRSRSGPIVIVGAMTALGLIIDIVLGAPLMQRSLLGYDPVGGSRYYGIGNEYMGILIGAALVTGLAWAHRRMKDRLPGLGPVALMMIIAVLLVHPQLGINVGGAITAFVAAGVLIILFRRRPLSWRSGLLVAGGIVALIAGIGLIDSMVARQDASHLGQAVQAVGESGADPLWEIFGRKVAVNLRLIRLTIWSRVVLLSAALLGALLLWPNRLTQALTKQHPWVLQLTKASMIAATTTLAVNDSGVVAASTLLLLPVLTVLSLAVGAPALMDDTKRGEKPRRDGSPRP